MDVYLSKLAPLRLGTVAALTRVAMGRLGIEVPEQPEIIRAVSSGTSGMDVTPRASRRNSYSSASMTQEQPQAPRVQQYGYLVLERASPYLTMRRRRVTGFGVRVEWLIFRVPLSESTSESDTGHWLQKIGRCAFALVMGVVGVGSLYLLTLFWSLGSGRG